MVSISQILRFAMLFMNIVKGINQFWAMHTLQVTEEQDGFELSGRYGESCIQIPTRGSLDQPYILTATSLTGLLEWIFYTFDCDYLP